VSDHEQGEGQGYNTSDPQMPFCPEGPGARPLGNYRADLAAWLRGPNARELRELDLARGIARRLRSELIYGMPAEAQVYEDRTCRRATTCRCSWSSFSRSSPAGKVPARCTSRDGASAIHQTSDNS
jgi:hypothetical protein